MNTVEHLSIKSWSEADRPREKLLSKVKKALTDAELLAILIGSGSRKESAVSLCKRILIQAENNLNSLCRFSVPQLTNFKGVGEAKAISIVAALELGRRQQSQEIPTYPVINSSYDVFKYMQPLLGDLSHEEFWVLYLNNSNKVIYKKMIGSGGLTSATVDLRLIFKEALEQNAVALILVHNHPSCKLQASIADKKMTSRIKEGASTLSLKVLDHIIVTEKSYFSFADENIL